MLWLRAFHRIYNPELAPAVLARVAADFDDAQLTMIGPDKGDGTFEQVRQAARALQVEDRLTLPGGVAKRDVPAWLDAGDLFLNTTDVDNTPVSVIEAMAAGLCIVSTNVGGLPYLLKDEHNALLVPPRNSDAMAHAVGRVLYEPGLAARLSRNARASAEQFDWACVLQQWETVLLRVAGTPAG
jgi:glycosyltransferase involved in cell wall biosynthesis